MVVGDEGWRTWAVLGLKLGRTRADLGPTWGQLAPNSGHLAPTWAKLGSNNAQNGATWASLAEVGPRRSSAQDRWGTRRTKSFEIAVKTRSAKLAWVGPSLGPSWVKQCYAHVGPSQPNMAELSRLVAALDQGGPNVDTTEGTLLNVQLHRGGKYQWKTRFLTISYLARNAPFLDPCEAQLEPKLFASRSNLGASYVAPCWAQVGAKLEVSGSKLGLVGLSWPQVDPMLRICRKAVNLDDVVPMWKMRKLQQWEQSFWRQVNPENASSVKLGSFDYITSAAKLWRFCTFGAGGFYKNIHIIPIVPPKAVAEVSKIGNL